MAVFIELESTALDDWIITSPETAAAGAAHAMAVAMTASETAPRSMFHPARLSRWVQVFIENIITTPSGLSARPLDAEYEWVSGGRNAPFGTFSLPIRATSRRFEIGRFGYWQVASKVEVRRTDFDGRSGVVDCVSRALRLLGPSRRHERRGAMAQRYRAERQELPALQRGASLVASGLAAG